jgi:hypothetical protein
MASARRVRRLKKNVESRPGKWLEILYCSRIHSHGSRRLHEAQQAKDKEGMNLPAQISRWEIAGKWVRVEQKLLYSAKAGTSARRGATTLGTS